MRNKFNLLLLNVSFFLSIASSYGHESDNSDQSITPNSHAPIGVMGDHLHKQGEWMVSYRFMQMSMEDNIHGSHSIAADDIVTQVSNPFAPPATARVVPVEMNTKMHMLGLMHAPSDTLTLMLMLNYLEKQMDHRSYMGMMGTNALGEFTTRSSGIGDTKISALWGLYNSGRHKLHLNLGISLPTGGIDEKDDVLTPMNTRPILQLPYAMQLGSGTYDFEPGITYMGKNEDLVWGAQFISTVRLGKNDHDYALGDKQNLTGWGSYRVAESASLSLRITYVSEDKIDGSDPLVTAPVTTANPNNYGGERVDLGFGINLVGQHGALRGHRLALEYQSTIDQNANGVQMKMQSMFTLGYQYAF